MMGVEDGTVEIPGREFGGGEALPSPILLPRLCLRPASTLSRAEPGRLFPVLPSIFHWLETRFTPGRATRLVGPADLVPGFLSFLLAAVATAERTVTLRDGANRCAPYAIAALGRRWGAVPEELLGRIRLARAFTAHQMVTMIETWVDDEIAEAVPADLWVASDPALLFDEEDVLPYERAALVPHLARRLDQIVRSVHRPLLLIEGASEPAFPWETEGLPVHECLRLERRPEGGVLLRAERARDALELVALAPHQHHMEEYDDDPVRGGVVRWDGPSLPTARR
jgi:hypothetical protein